MKLLKAILIACLALPASMNAQRIVTGPFHRPAFVPAHGAGGEYAPAILVDENKTSEVYTEDVTNNYTLLQEMYYYGTFTVTMYVYDKASEQTTAYLVSTDTLKKSFVVREGGFWGKPETFTYANVPSTIGNAALKVALIMLHEIKINPSRYDLK